MKNLVEMITERSVAKGLVPTFYYKCDDFFKILTNVEEKKNISAAYVKNMDERFIYFYKGSVCLGYLKLEHRKVF